MKILFVAAEAAPFVKAGGLGDVIGGLPKSLVKKGVECRVIIPYYSKIKYGDLAADIQYLRAITVPIGLRSYYCGIFYTEIEGVQYYFIDNEQYFNRGKIYGESDDGERFTFFSKAALELLNYIDYSPDIIHASDWHTALVPIYLNVFYRDNEKFKNIRTVFSIHNIEFQGKFNPFVLGSLFGLWEEHKSLLMYDGDINLMKGAIEMSDKVTTVSETYANEILTPYFSHGLHHILIEKKYKLCGFINGLDIDVFNPLTDKRIFKNFDLEHIEDKSLNKVALQEEMDLDVDPDVPLIGMVGRLTSQKGIDLLLYIKEELAKLDIQFILLGTGDPYFEFELRNWERLHHDKVRCYISFSNEMAQKIYASSDLFLMPSKSEPCGLAQMISMRYGTIPVVHSVGGLKDTVIPFDEKNETGNGFSFETFNAHDMLYAINRALDDYQDKETWSKLVENAMTTDFSWEKASENYIGLYNELMSW